MSNPDFRTVFCARIKALRLAQGMTQAEMAEALGVGAEAYRAYESRSLLPHHLIESFASITGIEIEGLFRAEDNPGAKAGLPAARGVAVESQ